MLTLDMIISNIAARVEMRGGELKSRQVEEAVKELVDAFEDAFQEQNDMIINLQNRMARLEALCQP